MFGFIDRLSRLFALLGGIVLTAMIVLTCLSILGRSINSVLHSDTVQSMLPDLAATLIGTGIGPINGDFELVEAGMAFAIFAFIPICQLHGAHASVDVFTGGLSDRNKRVLLMIIDMTFALVMALIAWQLFEGMLSKFGSGQTTFLLEFPLWWAYAVSLSGALVTVVVSGYIAVERTLEVFTRRRVLPAEQGAEH